MGEIAEVDIRKAKEYLKEVMSESCAIKYFAAIALAAISPVGSVRDISRELTENLLLNKVEGCTIDDIRLTIKSTFMLKFKSEIEYRRTYKKWPVD